MDDLEKVLAVIHKHCLKCTSGSWKDVENCKAGPGASPFSQCLLWIYRLGTLPEKKRKKKEE